MQYIVFTEDIYPIILASRNASVFEIYAKTLMQTILIIMLNIFLLFESLPNALSEFSYSSDREFYQDWWNASTMGEFFQKWIKFSYLFYQRHVYLELIFTAKVTPVKAKILTSIISSLLYELAFV